jgi:hypothetical protein
VGLDRNITVSGHLIAEFTGFFPATFGQAPDPMLANAPHTLGPRYTIVFSVPGPGGVEEIRQDLYPYAAGGPVTYTGPRQTFFSGRRTRGGWYVTRPGLKDTLVSLGLPQASPTASRNSHAAWMLAPLAALLFASMSRVARRRRT